MNIKEQIRQFVKDRNIWNRTQEAGAMGEKYPGLFYSRAIEDSHIIDFIDSVEDKYTEDMENAFAIGAEWQKYIRFTVKDIKTILDIAAWVLPKEMKPSEEEEYYTKILEEYNRIKK